MSFQTWDILNPGSKLPRHEQFTYAWNALHDDNEEGRMQSRCFLTHRAKDGEITFEMWRDKVQPTPIIRSQTPIGTRWLVSCLTAEVYLFAINGKRDEATARIEQIAGDVVFGAPLLWPACSLNWLRTQVIAAYYLHLDGQDIRQRTSWIMERWRNVAHQFDWQKWPLRVAELMDDIYALNILVGMTEKREGAEWLKPEKLLRSGKGDLEKTLLAMGKGNLNAIWT